MKNTSGILQLILIASLLTIGCDGKSNDPQPTNSITLQQYTFHYTGEPAASAFTLPQQLNDANWSLKETACEQAGYSLLSYAGQDITALKYNITETYIGEPLYLWVFEQNQIVICGYLSVRENSTAAPGVFALNDPNVK